MRFSRLESSFQVRFELYAELHLDYLPPGRISDNVVSLFYKRLGSIPRADNPQGSTVRGTATTCDFPGVNPSRCPPRGQSAAVNMMWMADEGIRGGTEPALIRKPTATPTVRGTPSTSNFPGVKPSRCPSHGQATTPAFRGADRLPSAHAASGCRKAPRRGHSAKPRLPSELSAGRTVGSVFGCPPHGQSTAVNTMWMTERYVWREGASIRNPPCFRRPWHPVCQHLLWSEPIEVSAPRTPPEGLHPQVGRKQDHVVGRSRGGTERASIRK